MNRELSVHIYAGFKNCIFWFITKATESIFYNEKNKEVFSIFELFEWLAAILNLRLKLFLIMADKNGPETASFPNSQDCCTDQKS